MFWILTLWGCHSRMHPQCERTEPSESPTTGSLLWRWLTSTPAGLNTCGITNGGVLACWGGVETRDGTRDLGLQKPFGDEPVDPATIAIGPMHGCMLDERGTPRCWLQDPSAYTDPSTVALVELPTGPLRDIATPIGDTCGLTPEGLIVCWGGWGSSAWDLSGTYRSITSGLDDLCAITADGHVACWQTYPELEPVPDLPNTIAISSEMSVACTLDSASMPHCFGDGYADFPAPPAVPLRSIDVSPKVVCGLTKEGTITCWGPSAATTLAPPPGRWSDVSCSLFHCCALAEDGSATCWGDNTYGQLNIPTAEDLR